MAACEADSSLDATAILSTPIQFFASQHILISCGTVPVDPLARKIATLRDTKHGIIQLPKGRKNVDEDLLTAALRETYEETGLRFEPLPLKMATRATPVVALADGEDPGLTEGIECCEVSSVCVYPCKWTGAFKMVFWFAAKGRVGDEQVKGTMEPWEEDCEVEWVDAQEAAGRMSTDGDAKAVEKVLEDMRRTGYDI